MVLLQAVFIEIDQACRLFPHRAVPRFNGINQAPYPGILGAYIFLTSNLLNTREHRGQFGGLAVLSPFFQRGDGFTSADIARTRCERVNSASPTGFER